MKKNSRLIILFSIALISFIMHANNFSKDLMSIHVWRQAQTQSTIVNFYEEDMNILNPRRNDRGNGDGVFRMEFPLMQWTVAVLYKVFGNHIYITRIFMFLISLLSVLGLYKLLVSVFQNFRLALIGAWTFTFSPSFYYHSFNPLPDNLALCLSIWGLAFFFNWYRNGKTRSLIFCGLFISLGALCKLPFIIYLSVPLTYFLMEFQRNRIINDTFRKLFAVSFFAVLPLAWYLWVIPQWVGNGIVEGALSNHVSFLEVLDILQSNLISTLPELLLNYGSLLFFILGFYFIYKNKSYKNPLFPVLFVWSMAIMAYFLFELNMIAKVHDYYLYPFFPILFMIVAYGANTLLNLNYRATKYLTFFLLLIVPVFAYLRIQYRWNSDDSVGFNKDLFTYKEDLRNAVPNDALCITGNDHSHFIFFYYINKKGWGFEADDMTPKKMKMMIGKGASYLYSDSRMVDTSKNISPFLDKLVLERGSVRVYSLKK